MCVLLSGSLVDVQPMSGLVHRFVFVSSHCIRHASVSCVPDCTPCDLVKMRTRRDSSWLIGAPVTLLSTSPERDDTILVKDPFED